jgi:hypothetical protein
MKEEMVMYRLLHVAPIVYILSCFFVSPPIFIRGEEDRGEANLRAFVRFKDGSAAAYASLVLVSNEMVDGGAGTETKRKGIVIQADHSGRLELQSQANTKYVPYVWSGNIGGRPFQVKFQASEAHLHQTLDDSTRCEMIGFSSGGAVIVLPEEQRSYLINCDLAIGELDITITHTVLDSSDGALLLADMAPEFGLLETSRYVRMFRVPTPGRYRVPFTWILGNAPHKDDESSPHVEGERVDFEIYRRDTGIYVGERFFVRKPVSETRILTLKLSDLETELMQFHPPIIVEEVTGPFGEEFR